MSWDKCTRISELNSILDTLRTFEIPYRVYILGNVRGRGANDDYEIDWTNLEDNHTKLYYIRKVVTGKLILMERMVRTCDCDVDDVIELHKFKPEEVPEKWALEIEECVCGHCEMEI